MDDKKQVVFIEGYDTPMLFKIAKEFRKRNYETILIRILKQDISQKKFFNEAYDKVIDLNLIYFNIDKKNIPKILLSFFLNLRNLLYSFIKILKLKPYIVIGRAPLSLPIAFFRIIFRKYPFIYFPYDIRTQAMKSFEEARKHLPLLEIKADRYCFEHSDGILHKGAPEELEYLNGRMLGDNIKLPEHTLSFQPYCSDEFIIPLNKNKLSKKDSETHLVYVGGILKPNKEYYFQQLNDYKELLNQKIHVHFYYCPELSEKRDLEKEKNIKESFREENKTFPGINYFHIHESFNPKEIVKEISKYDFGTTPYHTEKIIENHDMALKFLTGNKISTYFEAGIPFFYIKEHLFLNKLLKKYNLNLNWPDDMDNFKKSIKKLNYKKLEENILKARRDFNIQKNFPRLEKFVEKITEKKNRNI